MSSDFSENFFFAKAYFLSLKKGVDSERFNRIGPAPSSVNSCESVSHRSKFRSHWACAFHKEFGRVQPSERTGSLPNCPENRQVFCVNCIVDERARCVCFVATVFRRVVHRSTERISAVILPGVY